jgi:molecular chaperone GrpE
MDDSNTLMDSTEQHSEHEELAPPDDHLAELQALTAERDQLAAEKADLQDRLLRRTAEFDNFRRRAERERLEFSEYAGMDTIRALLPILDDFERALRVAPEGDEFANGMRLIYQRFTDALKKLGVEPIISVGQPFDPNIHHAVEMAQTEDAEDQTVLEEYQAGYNFRGRLLRPAMVKVAVKP